VSRNPNADIAKTFSRPVPDNMDVRDLLQYQVDSPNCHAFIHAGNPSVTRFSSA
jgi:hypothetical protein